MMIMMMTKMPSLLMMRTLATNRSNKSLFRAAISMHCIVSFRYSIGNSDLINGIEYGWLYTLANISQQPYTQTVSFNEDNETISNIEFMGGPSRKTMYVTALYYTMTCMTSVGFGNVAAETDNEKIFSICMMIVAGEQMNANP